MIFLLPLLFALATPPQTRFAVCADGNYHDWDDIGATPMTLALYWRAKETGTWLELVHYQYATHIGADDPSQHVNMILSAEGALSSYGVDPKIVFDYYNDEIRARNALAREISKSTSGNQLFILQAGPWESMARAFDYALIAEHQYVTIISHSDWNDQHEHFPAHRTKNEFFAQYQSGGKWSGVTPPTYIKIADQNGFAFRTPDMTQWEWMRFTYQTQFAYERTLASGYAHGDMSDAGMFWYLMTGWDNPHMSQIKHFFGVQ